MGFKRIKSSDLSMSPYTANKQYDVTYSSFTGEGIKIYTGQKVTGSFNSSTDPITTDNRYRRLIYDSINHKFYQNFSGSYIDIRDILRTNYYESASINRPSASYYDYKDVRATGSLPTDTDSTIKVIEIPTNMAGEGLSEGSVTLSSDYYDIWDDTFGNLLGQFKIITADDPDTVYPIKYIGNIIYNQGVLVITEQDYQSYFSFTEPTTTTTTTTSTTTTTTTPAPTTTTTTSTTTSTTTVPTTTTSTTTTTTTVPTTTTSTTTTTTTPAPTTTTTSTTTTTTTVAGGITITNNVTILGATLDSVGPSYEYILTSGSLPLAQGQSASGIISGGTVSFVVGTTGASGAIVYLHKNNTLVGGVTVGITGTVTLPSVTFTSSDTLFIELT